MKNIFAIALLSLAAAQSVKAHHGQDFLLIEDYQQAAPGQAYFISNFEWERGEEGNEYGFAPSLMVGILPRIALSVDTDFRKEVEGDWAYSTVTPAIHVQLSPTESKFPIKFGFSTGYQFHEGGGDEGEIEGGSIHNHSATGLVSRFIMESDIGNTKIVGNLLNLTEEGGRTNWGYAVGVRTKVVDQLAVGAEAMGDFKGDGWQELVAGVYYEPIHNITIKIGAGFGLTDATPDFALHTGLTWRF